MVFAQILYVPTLRREKLYILDIGQKCWMQPPLYDFMIHVGVVIDLGLGVIERSLFTDSTRPHTAGWYAQSGCWVLLLACVSYSLCHLSLQVPHMSLRSSKQMPWPTPQPTRQPSPYRYLRTYSLHRLADSSVSTHTTRSRPASHQSFRAGGQTQSHRPLD